MKLTFKEFSKKLIDWYNETRPTSGKPKGHVIQSMYEMYLNGQDFKFL